MSSNSRRKARIAAFKALYAIDIGGQELDESIEGACEEAALTDDGKEFVESLVNGVIKNKAELDNQIETLAKGYSVDRLAAVDRAILRLGAFEILFESDMPAAVAINEAVEVAKKYSTAESGGFVNGILGELVRRVAGANP